jgi:hypothetical protein
MGYWMWDVDFKYSYIKVMRMWKKYVNLQSYGGEC